MLRNVAAESGALEVQGNPRDLAGGVGRVRSRGSDIPSTSLSAIRRTIRPRLRNQIRAAEAMGISAFVVDWYGDREPFIDRSYALVQRIAAEEQVPQWR